MARQRMQPQAARRVGDLIVVFEEGDEGGRRQREARRAARRVLPVVPLPLEQIAVSRRRDQLLRRAPVVVVVGFAPAGQGDVRGMMEVVVPERVEAVAAIVQLGRGKARLLRFVLGDEKDFPVHPRRPGLAGDPGNDVIGGGVEQRLGRIEAQAVEVELGDPVGGVFCDVVANRPAALAVEVRRVAPLVLVAVGEPAVAELGEAVAGAEVVVDDVEDHADPVAMRRVDEGAQVVRRAVEPVGA